MTERHTRATKLIEAVATRMSELREAQAELNDVVADVALELGRSKRQVRQASKEMLMDSIQRSLIAAEEHGLDELRAQLGILADTPLGQAAEDRSATMQ